jgi:hypothetical protein
MNNYQPINIIYYSIFDPRIFFSVGQIFGEFVYVCDFWERFSDYEGAVAVDLDERFAG